MDSVDYGCLDVDYTYWSTSCPSRGHKTHVLVFDHLPTKLCALIMITHRLQIRNTLVHWNPSQFLTRTIQAFNTRTSAHLMVFVSSTIVFDSFLATDFFNSCQKKTVSSTFAEF